MSGSAVLGEVSPIREGVVVAAVDGALDASDWRVVAVVLRREVLDPVGRDDGVDNGDVGGRDEGGGGVGDGGGVGGRDEGGGDAGDRGGGARGLLLLLLLLFLLQLCYRRCRWCRLCCWCCRRCRRLRLDGGGGGAGMRSKPAGHAVCGRHV